MKLSYHIKVTDAERCGMRSRYVDVSAISASVGDQNITLQRRRCKFYYYGIFGMYFSNVFIFPSVKETPHSLLRYVKQFWRILIPAATSCHFVSLSDRQYLRHSSRVLAAEKEDDQDAHVDPPSGGRRHLGGAVPTASRVPHDGEMRLSRFGRGLQVRWLIRIIGAQRGSATKCVYVFRVIKSFFFGKTT